MMTSLLSIFDPCSFDGNMDKSWLLIMLFTLVFYTSKLYLSPSNFFSFFFITINKLSENFYLKNQMLVFSSMFFFIYVLNFSGLWPYVFSPTSHFSLNLSISIMVWLICVISDLKFNFKMLFSHFTPMGCPMILTPFMVIVEIVSFTIRPLTLGLRLMANMMAGHMILTLIASAQKLEVMNFSLIFMGECLFLSFELAVALIQAYVFCKLMHLYWSEE